MKASEAIKILQSLDPNHEVTLTLGRAKPYSYPPNTIWTTPHFVPQDTWPRYNEITCKYKH